MTTPSAPRVPTDAAVQRYAHDNNCTTDDARETLVMLANAADHTPAEADAQTVDYLAALIRRVDGDHKLGAAELAEAPNLADRPAELATAVSQAVTATDRISITRAAPDTPVYPKVDTYTWGEFAGLAIELGGYNDISAVDPYTGDRIHLSDAFGNDPKAPRHFTDGIRRLLDAIDQTGFGQPTSD